MRHDSSAGDSLRICFVGLDNLPVLAREFGQYGSGGEQVQQTLLARALVRRGVDVAMTVYDYGQPDGAVWDGVLTLRTFRQDAGVPVIRFVHPRWTLLWSALRRANADVYYVSCSGAGVGQVAHFAQRYGRRVIFRVAHDLDCESGSPLVRFWRDKKLYEYGLRHVDAVLVQSERQKEAMQRNFGLSSTIAGMLVEPAKLALAFAERDIHVLFVNNMNRIKRPERFLDLVEETPSLKSHMVGGPQPGFDWLFAEIARRAKSIPSLTIHGPVPYHDVNDFYERSRVFVNTSDSEGFPNSYLQAWVRGTPVVAFFDPDGIIEREGLGAAASDDAGMRDAVIRLASDEAQWQQVSARCREYMRRNYGDETILKSYLEAFRDELPPPRV